MRPQTPLSMNQNSLKQLLAFATEMRSKYILTDEDFQWKTDWSPYPTLGASVGGGTAVMGDVVVNEASYLHVGQIVQYVIDIYCSITLAGGSLGAGQYSFNAPPVRPRMIDRSSGGGTYVYPVGGGGIRKCNAPYLSTPIESAPPATVYLTGDAKCLVRPSNGEYIYTAAAGAGGFLVSGFYRTDILPVRAK